ncbi:MAG: alpha/beta hydrolase [Actinomycetes bacterium]
MTAMRPEIQELIRKRAELGAPGPGDAPVEELRRNGLPDLATTGPGEEVGSVLDTFIPGPTAYIPVRIITPINKTNSSAMVFFHGGGWVLSSVDHYDPVIRSLANKTGSIVIAPNYQKAPEHKFPIPFDDCYATLEWVIANAEKLGIDPTKVGVAGDSAGGNLAAAVALKNRDEGKNQIAYQVLVYPCCDDQFDTESGNKYAEGFGLTKRGMEWFVGEYVTKADRHNPYAFPIHAKSLEGVAPALVITSEYDVLRDDGTNYAVKLREDGVSVQHIHYEDTHHGALMIAGISDITDEMHNEIAKTIRTLTR